MHNKSKFNFFSLHKLILLSILASFLFLVLFKDCWKECLPFSLFFITPNEDYYLTGKEICQKYGYSYTEHLVVTEDGYINLLVQLRNPNLIGQGHSESTGRPSVLLIHGLVDSSDGFIVNGKENSIGFILADEGYDVWMANTRGNKYSNQHARLDPEKEWEYWDKGNTGEMAKYDLPAFIEYIRQEAGVEKLTVIANS